MRRALLSVSDKTGLIELALSLRQSGIEIISTGGTAKALQDAGIETIAVETVTGVPEMMRGRIKTLHPAIYAGILAERGIDDAALAEHQFAAIDFVVVNLYPFLATIQQEFAAESDAVENIDIGGPTMIRAAAKNFAHVAVLTNPSQYQEFIERLKENTIDLDYRKLLAANAFSHTAFYDAIVADYWAKQTNLNQSEKSIALSHPEVLRYGENPQQKAVLWKNPLATSGIAHAKLLQGKALSYNNLVDANAAWGLVEEFSEPAVAIIKHTNPCGVAIAPSLEIAYQKAFEADPVSAFGGVIAINQEVSHDLMENILGNQFVEVMIAPSFSEAALEVAQKKPNLRLLVIKSSDDQGEWRSISGGMIWQSCDKDILNIKDWKLASGKANEALEKDSHLAWVTAKHVKSNAIVLVKNSQVIGVGAGQMSRVDSVELAISRARQHGFDPTGSVLASDAFFPFQDGVLKAAEAGVGTMIQPGGSVRDEEVIAACQSQNVTLYLTGVRHFKH